jgi:hypothetical protein
VPEGVPRAGYREVHISAGKHALDGMHSVLDPCISFLMGGVPLLIGGITLWIGGITHFESSDVGAVGNLCGGFEVYAPGIMC